MIDFLHSFCRFLYYLSLFLFRCHLVVVFPAHLSFVAGLAAGSSRVEDAEVRLLTANGYGASTLGKVAATAILLGQPVRSFQTFKGQRNYPGLRRGLR